MIVLLFGPPGCGKGTQAALLAERFHIPSISTGEMFRAECKSGTELGKRSAAIMAQGGLVPDEMVNGIVAARIGRSDCGRGFLLDGYPRTIPQAKCFAELLRRRGLPEPVVIHLAVSDDALVTRLTARRQCPQCLRIYNLRSQPPKADGFCDGDGAALITREDDRESVIRQRLKAYREATGPLLDWYGPSAVQRVDGALAPEKVHHSIERALLSAFAMLA